MTHAEIEAIARAVYPNPDEFRSGDRCITDYNSIKALCDYILSGDHKREIENAAYERADREIAKWESRAHVRLHAGEMSAQEMRSVQAIVAVIRREVRALIQPPAQKENGE